mmetsp:Transcript_9495/g.26885  ORF Transcript_9495/g.26885 Transcript_9495/m.26885 type:complete len:222 (-) Transcript_9495:2525-3190(-)
MHKVPGLPIQEAPQSQSSKGRRLLVFLRRNDDLGGAVCEHRRHTLFPKPIQHVQSCEHRVGTAERVPGEHNMAELARSQFQVLRVLGLLVRCGHEPLPLCFLFLLVLLTEDSRWGVPVRRVKSSAEPFVVCEGLVLLPVSTETAAQSSTGPLDLFHHCGRHVGMKLVQGAPHATVHANALGRGEGKKADFHQTVNELLRAPEGDVDGVLGGCDPPLHRAAM